MLLHCSLAHSGLWKRVADGLADIATMVAPDLPSHGKSAPWDGQTDPNDASLDAVVEVFNSLDQPAHLIGHSFGAAVALRMVLQAPQSVQSLTLIEPVFFAAAGQSAEALHHRAQEEKIFEALVSEGPRDSATRFNALWGGGMPWKAIPTDMQENMARLMPFVVGTEPSLWQDCHAMLAPGLLEGVPCPVTFIRGAETVPIIAEVHHALMARIPDAVEHVVQGAGHMLTVSHSAEVAELLKQTMVGNG